MGTKISEVGLILSSYPYLRSAMVRFPLRKVTITKKSRIRETKYLSTDADSSTDAIGGDRLGQGGYNPDKI